MSAEWYYQSGGETHGPVSLDEMRRLAAGGRVGPATPVHREGEEWVVACQVRGLMEDVTAVLPGVVPAAFRPPAFADEDRFAPGPAAGGAVTLCGVATLVVAALLLALTVLSGYGSVSLLVSGNQAIQGDKRAGPGAGCGTIIGGALVVMGFALAAMMIGHAALAGGNFAAGAGILRRRGWARVLALVFSALTGLYGAGVLMLAGYPALSSPPPDEAETAWLAATASLGLLFLANMVFTWIVLLRAEGAAEFRPGRPPY